MFIPFTILLLYCFFQSFLINCMHSSLKIALIPTVKCLNGNYRPVLLQNPPPKNIWMSSSSFPPSRAVYQLFDLNEILYGLKWLSGKRIWTDVKVWTVLFLVSLVILRHDSIKKETSVSKKIFPLIKKNCIPSCHGLQAVVQIFGGQCSFKSIPKKWTW